MSSEISSTSSSRSSSSSSNSMEDQRKIKQEEEEEKPEEVPSAEQPPPPPSPPPPPPPPKKEAAAVTTTLIIKQEEEDDNRASPNIPLKDQIPANLEPFHARRPKYKSEAHLTSGLGYGRKKQELLYVFWKWIWPKLAALGWTKTESSADRLNTCLFFPPGITKKSGKRGKAYYDRIRLVITRLLERRNEEESAVADTLVEARSEVAQVKDIPSMCKDRKWGNSEARQRVKPRPSTSGRVDLSWKDGGTIYPKRSSRVGAEFQATDIPEVMKSSEQYDESHKFCDQVWDPTRGKSVDVAQFMDSDAAHNKKEPMLSVLHENNYELTDAVKAKLDAIEPVDGSDWTQEEKKKFSEEIFRLRKDLKALSQVMNKSMVSCLAYYLGTFKKSNHYRILKTVCVEEREAKIASFVHGIDECAICGDGGSLIICDSCEGEYHIGCLQPKLQHVPEGSWDCDECVNRKFLDARDRLVKFTSMYEKTEESPAKKQKVNGNSVAPSETISTASVNPQDKSQSVTYRPNDVTKTAVLAFATKLSNILSGTT